MQLLEIDKSKIVRSAEHVIHGDYSFFRLAPTHGPNDKPKLARLPVERCFYDSSGLANPKSDLPDGVP